MDASSSSSSLSRTLLRLLLLLAIGAPAEAWSTFHGRPAVRARGDAAIHPWSASPLLLQQRAERTSAVLMAEKPSVPSVSKAALVDAIALKAGVSKKTAAVSDSLRSQGHGHHLHAARAGYMWDTCTCGREKWIGARERECTMRTRFACATHEYDSPLCLP
jgi:hypothetical protein